MDRLTVKQWYSDAPFPKANKNKEAWTETIEGHIIEPSSSGVLEVKWDDGTQRGAINIELLREITPSSESTLVVETGSKSIRTKNVSTRKNSLIFSDVSTGEEHVIHSHSIQKIRVGDS